MDSRDDLKLWAQKWRWYERNSLPWNRARIHFEFARRRAFCRWPVHGNVLEMLQEGRLELGEHVLLEPGVWLTAPGARPGSASAAARFLNLGVQVAAVELVEIGEHCMFANGCFVTDGNHRFDDPDKPVPWQGFTLQGPDAHRRQRLVRRQRRHHERRHDRRALRDRRQLRRDDRPAAVLDRRRRARQGPADRQLPQRLTREPPPAGTVRVGEGCGAQHVAAVAAVDGTPEAALRRVHRGARCRARPARRTRAA